MTRSRGVYLVLGLVLMTAGTLSAASHRPPSRSTPDASTANHAQAEATTLLIEIEDHAQAIVDVIEPLDTRVRYAEVDAPTQSDELEIARDNINAMAAELRTLDAMKTGLQPWQRRELFRIQPLAVELADATKDAIQTFNQNPSRTWATPLPRELAVMTEKADAIRNSVGESMEVAKLNREIDRMDRKG